MGLKSEAERGTGVSVGRIGIAGEVRCVVRKADGSTKLDTGYQKNLILNQGLEFFGGGHGSSINQYCAIGSGNSTPVVTQNKLDAFIAISTDVRGTTSSYKYVDTGDGLYRRWEQKQYRFTGLSNANISEVGLVSDGFTAKNYYLTTRMLLKDDEGAPTTISVKEGETLDIYYKIHKITDTADKACVVNLLDGDGGTIPYNIVFRPLGVGTTNTPISSTFSGYSFLIADTGDLLPKTSNSSGNTITGAVTTQAYIANSFKRGLLIDFGLNVANIAIRRIDSYSETYSGIMPFQMRLGSVLDDAPLTKTNKDTLQIPLEVSWGRYEGDL